MIGRGRLWRYVRPWVLGPRRPRPGLFCCACVRYTQHNGSTGWPRRRRHNSCSACGLSYQSPEWWALASQQFPAIAKERAA